MNETTEAIDPDDLGCIRFAPHLRRPNWRPLAGTLVWTSRVVVVDELPQRTLELLGGGVSRFNWPASIVTSPTDPFFQATNDLTSFFPSGHGVSDISSAISVTAGQQVYAYKWANPDTGLASTGLWAQDEPINSGITGTDFTVTIPVATATALIINSDFSQTVVSAWNGAVQIQIHRGDPLTTRYGDRAFLDVAG